MAKFKDLDLRLNTDEKAIFGDGLEAQLTYTTISGYNTPSGVVSITPISQFVVNVPIAGEQATKPYHLVRFDQLADSMSDINPLDWQDSVITFSGTPPSTPADGDRYVVTSGTGLWAGHDDEIAQWDSGTSTWVFLPPNEGMTLRDDSADQFYTYDGTDWGLFLATTDHGSMDGLEDDDHLQYFNETRGDARYSQLGHNHDGSYAPLSHSHLEYVPVNGSYGFTGTVSGINPVADSDLATKWYVDDVVSSITGGLGPVVTLSGNQTITGDKVFDNNLTTFLGDVFFDGINITMSGTTLNTQSGAIFNYDSTSTINNDGATNYSSTSTITNSGTTTYGDGSTVDHESGSTETYETGSELTHESGSNETHESGSNDTYESGSNLTLSGTNVDVIGTTTMNFGDGTTITHESGSSEVYQGGSETTHESGSNDTYLDGANLTFSGSNVDFIGDTTINYGGDTVTTYEDNSTIINNGDTTYGDTSNVTYSGSEVNYEGDSNITYGGDTTTTYEDNSVINNNGDTFYGDTSNVTFSGTTVFETTPVFNEGLTIASGTTLVLEGVTISGTFINPNQKWGRIAVINGAKSQAVTFDTSWADDNYVVVATLTNEVDATPSIYSTIQGVKTGSGFTTHFSGKIDSGDFMLEWIAFYGQQK